MKAILCKAHGTPDTLSLEDVPSPELADDQVRIRVLACGINFPDVLMVAGTYQAQPDLPFTPGAELCGEIIEVGAACLGAEIGQRVIAMTGSGALAEEVCVTEAAIVPVPDGIAAETAAGFLLAYGTSWHALKQRARLRRGETLLVLGAAGGVGLAAVELGRLAGARVIAAASTAEKLELAKSYGAERLINYTDASLKDTVRELTDGRGADVIFDPVGGPLFDDCLRCIAWQGRILVVGFASGSIQKIPANLPLLKGAAVVGVFWGRFLKMQAAEHRENTAELLGWLREARLKPHTSAVLPLSGAAAALKLLATRRAMGKVVVKVAR